MPVGRRPPATSPPPVRRTNIRGDVCETKGATQLRLKHYRVDWDEFRRHHGPLAGLVNAGSSLDFTKEKGPSLLFLERVEGEGYQPLSGHIFPTDSVYLLRKLTR